MNRDTLVEMAKIGFTQNSDVTLLEIAVDSVKFTDGISKIDDEQLVDAIIAINKELHNREFFKITGAFKSSGWESHKVITGNS